MNWMEKYNQKIREIPHIRGMHPNVIVEDMPFSAIQAEKTMKKKKYYSVCVRLEYSAGCHIIKAYSKEDALRIREKHSISNPMGAKDVICIACKKVKMRHTYNKVMIERRRKGLGGKIWYEDKNGGLQTER